MFVSVVKLVLAQRTRSQTSVVVAGAFIPGVPVQPVLLRYPNKLVSTEPHCGKPVKHSKQPPAPRAPFAIWLKARADQWRKPMVGLLLLALSGFQTLARWACICRCQYRTLFLLLLSHRRTLPLASCSVGMQWSLQFVVSVGNLHTFVTVTKPGRTLADSLVIAGGQGLKRQGKLGIGLVFNYRLSPS